jgi:hypothetical protein
MRGVTTTQQTGKKWKGLQLLFSLGAIVFTVCMVSDPRPDTMWGVWLVFSIIAFIGARIGAWWDHG